MSEARVVTQSSGIGRLIENVDRVIKGKTAAVRRAVVCLVARGHLPSKTCPTSARHPGLARSIGCSFQRISSPATCYRRPDRRLCLSSRDPGFVFGRPAVPPADLADEINRTSPHAGALLGR
jgi:MoxR-like ATPase